MTKEYLEALNKIQHDFGQLKGQELVSCYETIFNALKRLEAIDTANPSEALECLEEWKYQINSYIDCSLDCRDIDTECYNHLMDELEQYYTTIKQALLKAQEQEKENEKLRKVLDIIKNKDVNVWYLTVSTKVKSYKDYNSFLMNDKSNRKLTEEEFDLLKEVLE